MAFFSQLLGDDRVASANGTQLKQSSSVGIIIGDKGDKAAHHVFVGGNKATQDVVDSFGALELTLNGPLVVAHHFLVGQEHALDAHRLERHFALGVVIQFGFHQAVGVSELYQRHELDECTGKQNDGNG